MSDRDRDLHDSDLHDSDLHDRHEYGTSVMRELTPIAAELRRLIPDVLEGYKALGAAAMAPGALDAKTKELIALALAVAKQCDGCIAAHARGAAKKGATRAEVAEAMGVAILMNGGPGTVYGPRALAAYDDFAAATPPAP
jgi:AhpD family alkylhydroperoxidase